MFSSTNKKKSASPFAAKSFMRADKRDQLQAEVLAARNQLQEQARAERIGDAG